MTHTIEIDSAFGTSADEIQQALTARGLESEMVESGPLPKFRVTTDGTAAQVAAAVEHALDAWVGERNLPLVPETVGDSLVVLRPPCG